MAAISLLGFNLPQGLTLSKSVTSNMASNMTNKLEGSNLSKTFSKITVQNVLCENNANSINISNNTGSSVNNGNTIVRKIKDFGMVGAVNNAAGNSSLSTKSVPKSVLVQKRPLTETKQDLIGINKSTAPVTKKLKQSKESITPKTAKKATNENVQKQKKASTSNNLSTENSINPRPAGTPGRKGLPLPQAVARRNARERNRVKLVNNGFAALRDRIPEEVAEAFEAQGAGRNNSVKKLSKVETLRMAVEYIRSLERLLGFDFAQLNSHQNSSSSGEDSYSLIKDEFDTLSPSMDDNFDDSLSNYDVDDNFSTHTNNNSLTQSELMDASSNHIGSIDLLPNITTLNGLQYIRIPGTNTYQLLTPDIFVGTTHSPPNSSLDDEHFSALIDNNCLSPQGIGLTTSPIHTINTQDRISPSSATVTARAPASPHSTTTTALVGNGECVSNGAIPLSRLSPVPQMQSTTSSPDTGSSSMYHQQTATTKENVLKLSPAEINKHSSCTTNATETQRAYMTPSLPQLLLPQFIKQEYNSNQMEFVPTKFPKQTALSVFQTTASTAGDQHATLSMSPPLDRCNRLLIASHHTNPIELQSFYEQDDSASFYETNLNLKKDFDDVLLDASVATNAGLSDESMIEAIDWWETHTPQSDGNSAVMM